MNDAKNLFEFQLRMYANLYFIIGILEIRLRKRIVITLSELATKRNYSAWTELVPKSFANSRSLQKALKKNRNQIIGIENFLSFSFWRHLFDGANYTVLWIPSLHKVFPNLENPLTFKSYAQIGNYLARASLIRNRVAHFNFLEAGEHEREKEVLFWLITRLGMDKAS
jgi:predicted helicase